MKSFVKLFSSFICLAATLAFAAYSGTPQTPVLSNGCYQIGSAEELYGFAELMNDTTNGLATSFETCAKLESDIVVNENVLDGYNLSKKYYNFHKWITINRFSGTFDGQGHTISGLYFDSNRGLDYVGLFGYVVGESESRHAVIKNLGVVDSYFATLWTIGAFANSAVNITIENCFNGATIEASAQLGGLVGLVKGDNLVINSYNVGYIHASSSTVGNDRYAGGLIGQATEGITTIKNSYNLGQVYTTLGRGGLVGFSGPMAIKLFIENSYSYGITDLNLVGAQDQANSKISISNSYKLSKASNDNEGARTKEDFASGMVAIALHYGVNGDIWGQNINADSTPNFSGSIQNYANATKVSKITLHTFEGDSAKYISQYAEGVGALLPSPMQTNHIFAGWYSNNSYTGERLYSISKSTSGNIELYAKWWSKPSLKNGCYEISDAGEMYVFAAMVNGTLGDSAQRNICGKLTADIVLNENVFSDSEKITWTPINNFRGTFDGQGHTISGLYYNNGNDNYIGLFRRTGGSEASPAVIQNVGLIDSYIGACWYIGGFVGEQSGYLTLKNVYSNIKMRTKHYGGGLVGYVYGNLTVINSYNASNSDNDAGLIGGLNQGASATIKNSFNYGSYDTGIFSYADLIGKKDSSNKILIENAFNNNNHNHVYTGNMADSSQFASGAVLTALHSYSDGEIDGSVWGQNVGTDPYPTLNANYKNPGFKISKATFHTNNQNDSTFTVNYVEGLGKFIPNPKEGLWIFKGWYESKTFDGSKVNPIQSTDKGNKEYYADWIKVSAPELDNDCYAISNVGELYGFASIVSGTFDGIEKDVRACGKLTNDIVFYDNLLNKDGTLAKKASDLITWVPVKLFSGTLDGQGYSIKGMYVDYGYVNGGGLFVNLEGDSLGAAVVKNLGIENSFIDGGERVGSIAGITKGTVIIENCYNASTIFGAYGPTGGFIGLANNGSDITITNSFNVGRINDNSKGSRSGGLIGWLNSGAKATIINSYNAGFLNDETFDILKADNDTIYSIQHSYFISFDISGDSLEMKGTAASTLQFADGSIAEALHKYNEESIDGSIWGQNVGFDTHPVLTGITTYSGTPVVIEYPSSSSENGSSSSEPISSSSENASSSSEPTSSSSKIDSSRSKTDNTSSSSTTSDLVFQKTTPNVSISLVKNAVFVDNYVGKISVFDVNGNLIKTVYSGGMQNFLINKAGIYIVKTGKQIAKISIAY